MAKVHPLLISNNDDASSTSTSGTSCSDSKYMTSQRETFTIWMKSLVMQGNGCTAFDENGEVVYRIDNYDNKHSSEVYLMDLRGKLLFTVRKQKMCVLPSWKGYKSSGVNNNNKQFFQVRKSCRSIFGNKGSSCYKVTLRSDTSCTYKLEGFGGRSAAFRITDSNGGVVAEAKRKQSSSGAVFGDDVLTLQVEPHVDHSFIMALVTVYGLIRHQM